MDWELSRLGLGDSIDIETAIIVLLAVLGLACIGPLLAMAGRSGADKNDGGHPLRSKLYSATPDRPSINAKPKYKTNIKY